MEDCFKNYDGQIVPSFQFLETASPTFRFMRLQPMGKLIASPETGVQSMDPLHIDRCRHALSIARKYRVELFLTPEYCIPMKLIDEILSNPELQPHPNTLWCLCCEGVSFEEYEDFQTKWADYAIVGKRTFENVIPSYFVGLLLYIFMSAEGDKLCIVPQFKIQPMREELHVCEQLGLSQGEDIVVFGSKMANRLVSVICADAYHTGIKDSNIFFPNNEEHKNIVLHPQLNSSPRHEDIAALRNRMFEQERGQHTLYITANWAYNTTTRIASRPELIMSIKSPWSSIYRRNFNFGRKELSESLSTVRKSNFTHGLGLGYIGSAKLKVWYAIKNEHLSIIMLRKPYGGEAELTRNSGSVQAQLSFIRNNIGDGWSRAELSFDSTLPPFLVQEAEGDYEYPLNANINELDRFFNYSLGYLEGNEMLLNVQEKSSRLSYHIDDDSEEFRTAQITNVVHLFRCLKQIPIDQHPSQIRRIQGGFKFHLVDKAPFNIISKQAGIRDGALVAYVEKANEARERALKLTEHFGDYIIGEKICVFSRESFSNEIIYYPKLNDDVTAAGRIENATDITQGGHSIEPPID